MMLAQSLRNQVHGVVRISLYELHTWEFAKSYNWAALDPQEVGATLGSHIFKEIGNERRTSRLDCGHHRRRQCYLTIYGVVLERVVVGDESILEDSCSKVAV
jgi:hypothetical protein